MPSFLYRHPFPLLPESLRTLGCPVSNLEPDTACKGSALLPQGANRPRGGLLQRIRGWTCSGDPFVRPL